MDTTTVAGRFLKADGTVFEGEIWFLPVQLWKARVIEEIAEENADIIEHVAIQGAHCSLKEGKFALDVTSDILYRVITPLGVYICNIPPCDPKSWVWLRDTILEEVEADVDETP